MKKLKVLFELFFAFVIMFSFVSITSADKKNFTIDDYYNFMDSEHSEDGMLICNYSHYEDDDEPWDGALQIYAYGRNDFAAVFMCRNCGYYNGEKYHYFTWGDLDIDDTSDDRHLYYWAANATNYGSWTILKDGDLKQYSELHDPDAQSFIDIYFDVGDGNVVTGDDALDVRVRRRFVDEGICPKWAYVSVDQQGKHDDAIWGVDGIYFSNHSEWRENEHPKEENDTTTIKVWSKFEDDPIFTKNYNLCLNDDSAKDYEKLFNEVRKFSSNKTLLQMYKFNNTCKIAEAVYENTASTSSCSYKNDALSALAQTVKDMDFCSPDEKPVEDPSKCSSYLGNIKDSGSTAYYLDKTFSFITYAAVTILIITSIIDYIKCLTSNDKDELKKVNIKTIKRLLFTFLLFLLPIILRTVLPIFGIISDCEIAGISG